MESLIIGYLALYQPLRTTVGEWISIILGTYVSILCILVFSLTILVIYLDKDLLGEEVLK